MKRLMFPVSMITLGSFLEIWYYYWRFSNDGIQTWLAVSIGAALTLLLALAVIQRRNKWAWFIIVPLAIYSIMATSAGQAFSLGIVLDAEADVQVEEANRQDEIVALQANIDILQSEYQEIREQINATVTSLADRGYWRTTLAAAEARQAELRTLISENQAALSALRSEAVTHAAVEEHSTNIYEFYNKLFGLDPVWLQFILQTILSAFIAVMVPIGILTLPKREPPAKPQKVGRPVGRDRSQWEAAVSSWVNTNWIGVRTKKTNRILQRETFDKFCKDRGIEFTDYRYRTIKSAAERAGVVDNSLITVYDEIQAKKQILTEVVK